MRTRHIMAVSLAVLALAAGHMGAVPVTAQGATDYWPTNGWRRSTPEQQGMDSTQLAKAVDYLINQRTYAIHSLLVIRNGTIVTDVYFYPFKQGEKHDLASVTKSITSTLVGVAIKQGYIASVRQPVLSFFPGRQIANVDADKNAMTLEDLLTMRAGLECVNTPTELSLIQMMQSQNWVQYALDLPMVDAPGERFVYCSPAPHLLQAVIQAATGQQTLGFATKSLFTPLGITDFIWPLDPQGVVHGWGDMRMTPYDMAKIGLLYCARAGGRISSFCPPTGCPPRRALVKGPTQGLMATCGGCRPMCALRIRLSGAAGSISSSYPAKT
jgi:CubicO group peptidase (beta-lactamase class C family)